MYKLYDAHRKRIFELDKELESQREVDELIKTQYDLFLKISSYFSYCFWLPKTYVSLFILMGRLQSHFENIQRVSDTVTLPYSMNYLRSRISEDLDLSHLTEKLMQGKGQSSTLSSKEKLELWERLKILSMPTHYIHTLLSSLSPFSFMYS